MIKKLMLCLVALLSLTTVATAATDGDWKIYPSFDEYIDQVIDTPEHVYIVALGQYYKANDAQYSTPYATLFVLDKSTGEIISYNQRNKLSATILNRVAYNEKKGYLLIVYYDGNIDMLYDDGRVRNMPGLKNSTIAESRSVNDIVFDNDNDVVYLATDFGFITINDRKGEISVSRNYHQRLNSIGRVGNAIVAFDENNGYVAPASSKLINISDFTKLNISEMQNGATMLMPINGVDFAFKKGGDIYKAALNESLMPINVTSIVQDNIKGRNHTALGYQLYGGYGIHLISNDGQMQFTAVPQAMQYKLFSSRDGKEYWFANGREGILSMRINNDEWTMTRQPSRPNAPTTFLAQNMAYTDRYGMMISNPGVYRLFGSLSATPNLICGLKNGVWTPYGSVYTNPEYANIHHHQKGLAQDPDNPDIFYSGSYGEGILRQNVADPTDIIQMTVPADPSASLPSFRKIKENAISGFPQYCNFSEPRFDAQGNMWCYHHTEFDVNGEGDVWVWPAEARRAINVDGWINMRVGSQNGSTYGDVFPLKAEVNRNLIIVSEGKYENNSSFYIVDHKGTLDNTDDDVITMVSSLFDQDGSAISKNYIWDMYEDRSTGTVWCATNFGIFTFSPQSLLKGSTSVRRIKVARNDGTNLADYLLDGVDVRSIIADGSGRKWFGTLGAGLVQTSADGSHVLRQLTTDNSYLPDNTVFKLCYNPSTNSIMMGTLQGVAEYFQPGVSSGENYDRVRAYPNPVRPDYVGWITIDGLIDNSLVKIVDAEGHIVKELGNAESGKVQWDGTNITGAKVNSGVYFVFMSGAGDGMSEANVTKILVVK